MPRVVHFEIHVDDPEKAIKFYTFVFGWKIKKWQGTQDYWTIDTSENGEQGINGGMRKRENPLSPGSTPHSGFICTVQVSSLQEYMSRVVPNGGQIVVPRIGIRGVGWFGYCRDTEGNLFGILEPDALAE